MRTEAQTWIVPEICSLTLTFRDVPGDALAEPTDRFVRGREETSAQEAALDGVRLH